MLKIKDNVDLKELKKFGLKKKHYYNFYVLESEDTFIMFKPSTKEIKFCGSFKNKVDIVNFSMDTKLLQAINKQVKELG